MFGTENGFKIDVEEIKKQQIRSNLASTRFIEPKDQPICDKCQSNPRCKDYQNVCIQCYRKSAPKDPCYDCIHCINTRSYLNETNNIFKLISYDDFYGSKTELWQMCPM